MAHRIRTHPGEILAEEFLKPLRMTVNALALELRVPANRLGEITKKQLGSKIARDVRPRAA